MYWLEVIFLKVDHNDIKQGHKTTLTLLFSC